MKTHNQQLLQTESNPLAVFVGLKWALFIELAAAAVAFALWHWR